MTHACTLCNKSFHNKTMFDKHDAYCKFTHSALGQKKPEQEHTEKLTEKQKTKLILDLLYKQQEQSRIIAHMQKEIQNLKTRQRISMTKWLTKTTTPIKSFIKWIQSIPVTQTHLEKVFIHDLLYGVTESIKEEIAAYKFQNKQIPIYAFTQKAKTVYVYDSPIKNVPQRLDAKEEVSWSIITSDHLKKMFSILHKKIEDQYDIWQKQHSVLLNDSEEWKEKGMIYARKVMGMMDNEKVRNNKLKQWLYTQIHLPFQEVTIDLDS